MLSICVGLSILSGVSPADEPSAEAKAHYDAGMAHKQAKEYDAAAAELQAAVAAAPDYVDAQWALAWVYVAAERKPEAIETFRRVIELVPDTDRAREAQATVERLGGTPDAPASEDGEDEEVTLPPADVEEAAPAASGWAAYEENHTAAKELGLSYSDFARLSLPQGAVLCAPFSGSYDQQGTLNSTATQACSGLATDQWQALVAGQYLYTVVRWDATETYKEAQEEVTRAEAAWRNAHRSGTMVGDHGFIGLQPGFGDQPRAQASLANVLPSSDGYGGGRFHASVMRISDTEVRVTEEDMGGMDMVDPAAPRTWVCRVGDRLGPSLIGPEVFVGEWDRPIESIVEFHDRHVVTAAWSARQQRWSQLFIYQMKSDAQGAPLLIARPTAAEAYLLARLMAAQALAGYCQQEYAKGQRKVKLIALGALTVPYSWGRDRGSLYELTEAKANPAAEASFNQLMGKPFTVPVVGCRPAIALIGETLMRDRGETGATAEQVQEIAHQVVYGTRVFGSNRYKLPMRIATEAVERAAPELLRAKVPEWALEAVKAELSFPPTAEQLGYNTEPEPDSDGNAPPGEAPREGAD